MDGFWTTIWQGLLAGIIVGPLARLVLPGKQSMSIVMTILIGAVGAIGGGLLYEVFGGEPTAGIDWIKLIVQVGVAVLTVVIFGALFKPKSTAT